MWAFCGVCSYFLGSSCGTFFFLTGRGDNFLTPSKVTLTLSLQLRRTEGQLVNLRIECDMVKKDLADTEKEKRGLQLELSTARIEFNYHQQVKGKS